MALSGLPATAQAACTPNPTVPSGLTNCSGSDGNGLVVASNNSTVLVPADGSVSNIGAPAIAVAIASGSNEPFRNATIDVAGTVDGNGQAGIAVTNGTAATGIYGTISTRVAVTVADGGLITGGNGITIAPSTSNTFGYALVTLDNAGTITGTKGPALTSTGNFSRFASIVNQAEGFIGGIAADVSTVENHGRIEGGGTSAISDSLFDSWIINSGSIASTSAASTITSSQSRVDNTGTITNFGTGAAIGGTTTTIFNSAGAAITATSGSAVTMTSHLTFDNAGTIATSGSGRALDGLVLSGINREGATISSGGPTAIYARWSLNMTNLGEIVGDVYAGPEAAFTVASSVDSTQGTIRGNLTFGAGSDQLYATYTDADGLWTGVSGTIDGGGGIDTLQVRFASDATLATAFEMPRNFETLGLITSAGTTVTLSSDFSAVGALELSGSGQLVNQAALQAAGTVIGAGSSNGAPPSFRNEGSVVSTGATNTYAVLGGISAMVNTGTITSASNGVTGSSNSFVNSGTIVASGTAANLGMSQGFQNSGTIRSDAGTGLVLVGSSYLGSNPNTNTNSGTIEGAVAGVNLSGALLNSGAIRSVGQAVILGSYSRLENATGGTISGGVSAIAAPQYGASNATVINAGTIVGDVSFVGDYPAYGGNRFFAQAGGVLNGNLTLGQGDTLIAELPAAGAAPFVGINGTVTATDAALRYVVRSDVQALFAPVAGFRSIGYDLYDGATLALSGEGVTSQALTFAGTGSVTLDLDLAPTGNNPAIMTTPVLDPYASYVDPGAVSITSNGTITYTRTNSAYASSVVMLGADDTFINAGTIRASDTLGANYGPVTAVNGGSVVNSGTIAVSGGVGVSNAQWLTNTGTIVSNQAAVGNVFDGIVNSGTLTSTGGAAIVGSYGSPVDNRAGGTITGNGTAIQMGGGMVINAGIINGTVDLGYSPYGASWNGGTYVDAGGRLDGDLLFGNGDDHLIETGAGIGITGTIDAGDGFDSIGHQRTQSGTVTLGQPLLDTFEGEFTLALGKDTVVTLAAEGPLSADVQVSGDGQIINTVATSGRLTGVTGGAALGYLEDIGSLTVVNQADVGGGILLSATSLTNTGGVGSRSLAGAAVSQGAQGSLTFENAGSLRSRGGVQSYYHTAEFYGNDLAAATLVNSGSIVGNGLYASLSFDADSSATGSFDNSGVVAGNQGTYFAIGRGSEAADTALSFAIRNSGTIAAWDSLATALTVYTPSASSVSITNSGTISTTQDGYSQTYRTWGGVCYDYNDQCYPMTKSTNPTVTISTLACRHGRRRRGNRRLTGRYDRRRHIECSVLCALRRV
jgi:hypothetical protein